MAIDIELFLARHPFLFLGWKCGIEGFHSGGVLAAIGGGGGDIHPLFAVKRAGPELADKESRRVIAGNNEADILLLQLTNPRLT